MEINFRYLKHIDLVYHLLAHMKVENASNLFSQKYIEYMQKVKPFDKVELLNEIKPLELFYNNNFERLAIINFLPFYSDDLNELIKILLTYENFNQTDKDTFIIPFIRLLEHEAATFYYNYWEGQYKVLCCSFTEVKNYFEKLLEKYQIVFNYFKKAALVYFSFSLTRNGRGFGIKNNFSACIPFPINQYEYQNAFFTLLHEYTHQFTDQLVKNDINMHDGSHDLSENIVILFDYYLIKNIDNMDIKPYFKWLAMISGHEGAEITEGEFLSIFKVPDEIKRSILRLLDNILLNQS